MFHCSEREKDRERERRMWAGKRVSCCHVLLFVCGRFHFIYSYCCRYSWSGSNRDRRTGEKPVERGLHESCLISPGAKMGNRAVAPLSPSTRHARISYFHIFAWPFATVFPACQAGETGGGGQKAWPDLQSQPLSASETESTSESGTE